MTESEMTWEEAHGDMHARVTGLRAEVAALRAEVAALRGHACPPSPSCTCGGTVVQGTMGCPVHSWQQVSYPGTAPSWYFPTNVCAGAAGYPGTVIVNTTACADAPAYRADLSAAGCAGGYAGQVYSVTIPA